MNENYNKLLERLQMINYEKMVGKIAADRNNRKLGKIIKIEPLVDTKTKIPKNHVLILVQNFMQKDVVILLEVDIVLKATEEFVWFDILKVDFDQEVRETRALIRLTR